MELKQGQQEVMIYSQDNLNKELENVVNKEFKNKGLIKSINVELAKKNLNTNITAGLFLDGSVKLNKLSKEEKIAITKVCYEVLALEKLNYRKYFSDTDILDYNSFTNVEKKVTQVVLPFMQKVDNYNYVGRITYEQIYNYIKFVLFRYNKLSQIAYKTKSLGTKDDSVRIIDINQKNVDAMTNLLLSKTKKLEDTQIIVNIRLAEGEENFEPNRHYESIDEEKYPNVGTLYVSPNYDLDSETFTVIDMLDGFHRMLAVYQAVEQYKAQNNGAILQGGLDIRVVLRSLSDAQELIRQIFERSDTNPEFIKGFKQGDDVDFLKLIEENSTVLKDEIALNFEERKMVRKLTYKTILLDALTLTEIPVEKKGLVRDISKKLGSTIDELIDTLKFKYFNDDIEEMKNNSSLLDCNMFVGYLAIANTMRVLGDYNRIDEIVDNIYSIPESELKKLKLKNSPNTCNYKDVYNYFANLTVEVLRVA